MKAVLVTGAAKRIGKTIAWAMAADGWDVAVHCHASVDDAKAVAAEIERMGRAAAVIRGDLADPETPERLIAESAQAIGGLSCLINNASRFESDEVGSITLDSWSRHLDANLRAPVFLSQAFAAQLPPGAEGNIVNIVDQRVLKLTPKFFSYTASKAALWTVTRTLAQALAPRIRVNAIGPGPTLPTIRMDQEDFAAQCRATPLGRGTSPEEVAATIRFILAQPSMTGQMILLDGGQHLAWRTRDVTDAGE